MAAGADVHSTSPMSATQRPAIAIIGPGKVGRTLGALAARARWPVAAVAGRTKAQAAEAAADIGPSVLAADPPAAARKGDLVLLTVDDDAIADVCSQLADAGALDHKPVVAHCSGAYGSEILSPAAQKGCPVGSLHPFQTFPTLQAAAERLPQATCFIDGDPRAAEVLEALARALGCRVAHLPAEGKTLYHAAAVFACNYLVALLDAAAELAEAAGVDRATYHQAAEPLVRTTVDNVFALGAASALTGPIARGDVHTVQRHLKALAVADPLLQDLYRVAGRWTIELATRKGTLNKPAAEALRNLLSPQQSPAGKD